MYLEHQPIIAAHARSGPDGLGRVLRFAMVTARRPLYLIAEDYADIEAERPGADDSITQDRMQHWFDLWAQRRDIYWQCEDIVEHAGPRAADYLVGYLATLPGLGLAKAGFAAQMAYGLSGCLDTHNHKRFGIRPRTFDHYKRVRTVRGRRRFAARYNAVVDRAGGTAALWNGWCFYVALRRPKVYLNANIVSALHVAALGLNGYQVSDLLAQVARRPATETHTETP